MSLWTRGGAPDVRLVFLFKWSKLSRNRVSGAVEVWTLNAAGTEQLVQSEVVINLPSIVRSEHMGFMTNGSRYFPASG